MQQCLRAIASTEEHHGTLLQFVGTLNKEADKPTIAPANAFVLTEWFSVLLEQLSEDAKKREWYLDVVKADARVLDTCLGSRVKSAITRGALVVTRRGLRKLFKSEVYGPDAAKEIIRALAAKGSSTPGNASMLGVVAGVASRLPTVKTIVEEERKEYYAFYVRDILSSRTKLPDHVAHGLHDFFASFATLKDLGDEVVPALEKALLRAPEVVLNNLVAPMVLSLDSRIDLSRVLQANLLKPLLSNIKSTNMMIRDGALRTFTAIASRSHEASHIEKAADEFINPLRQGKITSVDQRMLHAQMLGALSGTKLLAQKVASDLATVALKEANEGVLSAETEAIAKHVSFGIQLGETPDTQTTDLFVKGLSEKRSSARRLWSLRVGDILWNISLDRQLPKRILPFGSILLGKLLDSWREVVDNPLPAIQSGLLTPAYIVTALSLATLREADEQSIRSIIKKASIAEQSLVVEPKPSFLLSPRVYTKLTGEENFIWCARALVSTVSHLPDHNEDLSTSAAWGQAFLFVIAAAASPHNARREAIRLLSEEYLKEPIKITTSIIAGLWRWVSAVELQEKDSPAMAAKTGCDRLHLAIDAICPVSHQDVESRVNEEENNAKLINLLVLSRPEIIPYVTWIDICLKSGTDPGDLVRSFADKCLGEIMRYTEVCCSSLLTFVIVSS